MGSLLEPTSGFKPGAPIVNETTPFAVFDHLFSLATHLEIRHERVFLIERRVAVHGYVALYEEDSFWFDRRLEWPETRDGDVLFHMDVYRPGVPQRDVFATYVWLPSGIILVKINPFHKRAVRRARIWEDDRWRHMPTAEFVTYLDEEIRPMLDILRLIHGL